MTGHSDLIRVDKWLWQARFFKSRSLASKAITGGGFRINSDKNDKPSRPVKCGDVLTFLQGKQVRVIRIKSLGHRRGPASEAAQLYDDISPKPPAPTKRSGPRPTKKARRDLEAARHTKLD